MKLTLAFILCGLGGIAVGLLAHDAIFGTPADRFDLENRKTPDDDGETTEPRRDRGDSGEHEDGTSTEAKRGLLSPKSQTKRVTLADVTGDGAITGVVFNASDDTPVQGVVITATLIEESERLGDDIPIEVWTAAVRQREQRRRAARAVTMTDEKGRFTIADLAPESKWFVRAELDGWSVSMARFHYAQRRAVMAGDELEFSATPLGRVSWRLNLPDGEVGTKALIQFKGTDTGKRQAGEDVDEMFLPIGRYTATATAGIYEQYVAEPVTIDVVRRDNPPIEFEFTRRPVLVVHIQDERPRNRRETFWLIAERASVGDEDVGFRGARGRGISEVVRPGEEFVVFKDLLPGEIKVANQERAVVYVKPIVVTLGDSTAEATIVVELLRDEDSLRIRPLGPTGEAVKVDRFSIQCKRSRGGMTMSGVTATRSPDGTYSVPHGQAQESDEGDEYAVILDSEQFASRTVPFDPLVDREITVRFETPANLTVDVTGPNADQVTLSLARGKPETTRSHFGFLEGTARGMAQISAGKFSSGNVEPGRVTITVTFGASFNTVILEQRVINLVAGPNVVAFNLRPLSTLTVVIPEGQEHVRSLYAECTAANYRVRADRREDDHFVFENMPPQVYELSAEGSGKMQVNVTTDTTITLDLPVLNAYLTVIDSNEGTMAKAGFLEGDLIVGVDGKRFDGAEETMAKLMTFFRSSEPTKLMVVRDGRTFNVTVTGAHLTRGDLGGRFEPATQ